MTRIDPQMKIRIPDDLKRSIEEQAKIAGRSMNSEIISRLQASFKAPMDLKREQLKLFIDQAIDERVELLAQMQSPASKAIDVLVRGKRTMAKIPEMDTSGPILSDGPKAAPRKRPVLVGNIGRVPPPAVPARKQTANKGTVKRARGKPPVQG